MTAPVATEAATPSFTTDLVEAARATRFGDLSAATVERAKHCLLDIVGVTVAGSGFPAIEILRSALLADSAAVATLVGSPRRASTLDAALVNGTASHVLDFDDCSSALIFHPTAPVASALLALAEREQATGAAVIAALVVGLDLQEAIGERLGNAHFAAGWHATGTLGTFGAAAACAHLLGLDADQWHHALGIAGTQAAGLRSVFGTMAKSFHVGKAAYNGLLAADLARAGFTSDREILDDPRGFMATHAGSEPWGPVRSGPRGGPAVERVFFKYYASCFGTHSAIEGARALREAHGLAPGSIESVEIRIPPISMGVCNIQEPATALEAKFSVRTATAMALLGQSLGETDFRDHLVVRPELVALRDRISVVPDTESSDADRPPSTVVIRSAGGDEVSATVEVGEPADDRQLSAQFDQLSRKFQALVAPVLGEQRAQDLLVQLAAIERAVSVSPLVGGLAAAV